MPRYVILEHTGSDTYKPGLHWDLMLELGDTLRCWELATPPTADIVQPAIALPDHRLAYLDHEGPVSNDRGNVTQWDAGEFELISETPHELIVSLLGGQLSGIVQLLRDTQDESQWKFLLARI